MSVDPGPEPTTANWSTVVDKVVGNPSHGERLIGRAKEVDVNLNLVNRLNTDGDTFCSAP